MCVSGEARVVFLLILSGCSNSGPVEKLNDRCALGVFEGAVPWTAATATKVVPSSKRLLRLHRTTARDGRIRLHYSHSDWSAPSEIVSGDVELPNQTAFSGRWGPVASAGRGFAATLWTDGPVAEGGSTLGVVTIPETGPPIHVKTSKYELTTLTGATELPDCDCALFTKEIDSPWPFKARGFVVRVDTGTVEPWSQDPKAGAFEFGSPFVVHGEIVGSTHVTAPGGKDGYAWFAIDGKILRHRLWRDVKSSQTWAIPLPSTFAEGRDGSTWVARGVEHSSSEFYTLHVERYLGNGELAVSTELCGTGIMGLTPAGVARPDGGFIVSWDGIDSSRRITAFDQFGRHNWTKPLDGLLVARTGQSVISRVLVFNDETGDVDALPFDDWGRLGCEAEKSCPSCQDGDACTLDDCSDQGKCVHTPAVVGNQACATTVGAPDCPLWP